MGYISGKYSSTFEDGKNEVTPADTFDASTVVYVFTIDWENESEKFEKKTVSELTKYDRLPDNIYLTSHPNRLEKYADSLQTVYKAQTALCCSKRYVACCVRSVDVTNELLSSLILSKANYPVRLNVEISIGKTIEIFNCKKQTTSTLYT